MGKVLILVGSLILLAGAILELWTKLGGPAPGQLPGDISIQRDGLSFQFPVVSCIVISIILSGVLWVARRFF